MLHVKNAHASSYLHIRDHAQCLKDAGQGFFQDFRQEGANVTIVELRGGMYYCCIFQGFCHRGNVIAHS